MTDARVVLSDDRRRMTINIPSTFGIHRAVLVRGEGEEPFGDADIQLALEKIRPTLTMPGQRNVTRRWVTPVGSVYLHLMFGPPTWWLPKVRVRGGLMIGWLRLAVAVGFKRAG